LAIVQTSDGKGITLKAEAEGLRPAEITLKGR
jgi:hypothetical protein